jgi:hypothetical protein
MFGGLVMLDPSLGAMQRIAAIAFLAAVGA